jgi:hypothetical protein
MVMIPCLLRFSTGRRDMFRQTRAMVTKSHDEAEAALSSYPTTVQ